MKPLNRRLLIEVIKENKKEGVFFVPVEEQPAEFLTARVVACAADCSADLTDKKIVFHAFGVERVKVDGHEYIFIGENHLIGVE